MVTLSHVGAASAFICLVVGIILFVQFPSRKNGLFLLCCAFMSLWSWGGLLWCRELAPDTHFISYLISTTAMALPSFYYRHVLSVLALEGTSARWMARASMGVSVVFVVVLTACWPWRQEAFAATVFSLAMPAFLLHFALTSGMSAFHFWTFRNGQRSVRYVFMYATFMFGLSLVPTATLIATAAWWAGFDVSPLFHMGWAFYAGTFGFVCFDMMFLDVNLRKGYDTVFSALLLCWLCLFVAPVLLSRAHEIFSPPYFNNPLATVGPGLGLGLLLSVGSIVYTRRKLYRLSMKNHLTSEITSELNAPLMAVHHATQAAMKVAEASGFNRVETISYVNTVEQNITLLEDHIAHLLNLAAIYEHKILLDKRPHNLGDVVERLVDRMQPLATQKGLTLEMKLGETRLVDIDEDKIREVISRLLQNAIKYSQRGSIRVELTQRRDEIQLDVIDQGQGLSEQEFLTIFEMRNDLSGGPKKTGVNMAVAHGWITAHSGKIWIASKGKGQGSTATFILPN